MNQGLIQTLNDLHEEVLTAIGPWNQTDAGQQLHPELSPALWHVGHIAVVEAYWLRQMVLNEALPPSWPWRFFPEYVGKCARAAVLPPKDELLAFAANLFRDHEALLAALTAEPERHSLLRNGYLAHFLVQHCAQHRETLAQIAQQRMLGHDPSFNVLQPLVARDPILPAIEFPPGHGGLGNSGEPSAYDNELPRHITPHGHFWLAERAASNAEYLGFMQANGYGRRDWWSEHGWRWRLATHAAAPMHWRRDPAGQWYAIEPHGPTELHGKAPVQGISCYEAEAFANYCNCRLPTEKEWEHAANCDAIERTTVWEWCGNSFYPYPGYTPFPYPRYSQPWFDGRHFALRGGSDYTHASVRRKTFRNFYTADKRHIFSGVRLAIGALNA